MNELLLDAIKLYTESAGLRDKILESSVPVDDSAYNVYLESIFSVILELTAPYNLSKYNDYDAFLIWVRQTLESNDSDNNKFYSLTH